LPAILNAHKKHARNSAAPGPWPDALDGGTDGFSGCIDRPAHCSIGIARSDHQRRAIERLSRRLGRLQPRDAFSAATGAINIGIQTVVEVVREQNRVDQALVLQPSSGGLNAGVASLRKNDALLGEMSKALDLASQEKRRGLRHRYLIITWLLTRT
jgi:hypothetical protein